MAQNITEIIRAIAEQSMPHIVIGYIQTVEHLECWCVQREPEQSTFQLEHEHRLPLRSTLRCQNRKLHGLPTVRGDKGTCFHSG